MIEIQSVGTANSCEKVRTMAHFIAGSAAKESGFSTSSVMLAETSWTGVALACIGGAESCMTQRVKARVSKLKGPGMLGRPGEVLRSM